MTDHTKDSLDVMLGKTVLVKDDHKRYQLKTLRPKDAYFDPKFRVWYQIVNDGEGPPSERVEVHTVWVLE